MQSQSSIRHIIGAIALFMLLTGLSCSLLTGGAKQPASAPSQAGGGEKDYTPVPAPTLDGTLNIDQSLAALNSYQGHLTVAFRGDQTPVGKFDASADLTIEEDRPADAYYEHSYLIANPQNPPVGDEMYWIGDKEYQITWDSLDMQKKTSCMIHPYQKDPHSVHSGFNGVIIALKKGPRVGQGELVNGVKTDHYQVTGAQFITAKNEIVSGDVWVAQDGGYIVKAAGTVEADLEDDRNVHGRGDWAFELTGINSTTITPDPLCQQVEQKTDFPLPPDAKDVFRDQNILSFSTPKTAQQTADYYKQALPPLGYAIEEQSIPGDNSRFMWQVTRDGQIFMLDIMQSNGMTLVNWAMLKTP